MSLASEITNDNIKRLSFVEEDNMLMTTGSVGGQSVVQPSAGLYDYSDIRAFLRKEIYATDVSKENASVIVLNSGTTSGLAQETADELEELGMNIIATDNVPEDYTEGANIYRLVAEDQKTATAKKLKELYEKEIKQGNPPFTIEAEADFVVIIGD